MRAVFESVPGVHLRVNGPYFVDHVEIYKIRVLKSRVDAGNTFKNGSQNRDFSTFLLIQLFFGFHFLGRF